MNIFTISFIIVLISSSIIAIFVLWKGKDRRVKNILAAFCSLVALWGLGGIRFSSTSSEVVAFFWRRIANITVIFSPVLFYHFVYAFLKLRKKFYIYMLLSVYTSGFVFLILNFFFPKEVFIGGMRFVFNQFYYTDWWQYKSPLYLIFYISFFWILLPSTLLILLIHYKYSKGIVRNQLKYFILGSIIGWLGPFFMWLIEFRIDIYPYSNFLVAIYPAILAYAIIKYRLLDIRVFISRATAFLISYPLFLGVPFVVAYRLQPYLYPSLGMHWWLIPSGLLVFFATLSPLAYGRIKTKMEDTLLAEQKRYQKLLLQAAGGMVRERDLDRLAKLIVYIAKKIVKISFAAIFLKEAKEQGYRLKAMRGESQGLNKDFTFVYQHSFIDYLMKNKEPFYYEEMPLNIRKSLPLSHQLNLIIPSFIEDNLLGFVFLGEKLNHEPYTQDDINVFKIISHQAALSIENCVFLKESKEFQKRIFTAEKLASLGGMADGLSHQIKNRLNHFSIASGELKYEISDFIKAHPDLVNNKPELRKTFDYVTKIADSLISNVKRTDGVIRGILAFARTEEKDTFFSYFPLKEIINLSLELLNVKHHLTEFPLKVSLPENDTIYGVKSQLVEAVYNILDNAYEAIYDKVNFRLKEEEKETFTPEIKLKLTQPQNAYLIEISDNGSGIKNEDKLKIFAPFFTTKSSYKSGTGIGIYVVKRMIEENLKGKVTFTSEYMKGTTFLIELPKKKKK